MYFSKKSDKYINDEDNHVDTSNIHINIWNFNLEKYPIGN